MVFRIIGVCSIVWVCGLSGFFVQGVIKSHQPTFLPRIPNRVAQCIDKEILIRKICNIDIGIDIDKENFEKLIIY